MYHLPVLLNECIEGLNIDPNGVYVDVTFGGGGHSAKILAQLENGQLFAFDQDADALANTFQDDRFTLIHENFKYLKNFLRLHGIKQVDGILADLGVSSHQFDTANRGFSTRFDGPIDGRMDQRQDLTGAHILNTYEPKELTRIFRLYGELKNAFQIGLKIVETRNETPYKTIGQLKESLLKLSPRNKENRFFAQVFQALRIEVNQEMTALEDMLMQCEQVIKPGGRLVVLSYHSLEDRIAKNIIRTGNVEGELNKDFFGKVIKPWEAINRKPIVASSEEIEKNSRARSAKLRVAELWNTKQNK
ncbi:MAG: 16S rRNA (cytosine(1402)-N(4))-methyltransferase [Bacteroidetes bacterium 4572_77]|nr:MAG: 16S rRNA (cytosine(1402)-N(4))-methyltransferase [Bacteroidetes bacterium 4572_77]